MSVAKACIKARQKYSHESEIIMTHAAARFNYCLLAMRRKSGASFTRMNNLLTSKLGRIGRAAISSFGFHLCGKYSTPECPIMRSPTCHMCQKYSSFHRL